MGPVDAGRIFGVVPDPDAPGVDVGPAAATVAPDVVLAAEAVGVYRVVARTTASATASMLGGTPGESAAVPARKA